MKRKLLSAASVFFIAMSMSPTAFGKEVVEFGYTTSELATPAKTAKLLERLNFEARASCETGSAIVTERTTARCADDLVRQFVEAIGDERLTRLAANAPAPQYRSAAR